MKSILLIATVTLVSCNPSIDCGSGQGETTVVSSEGMLVYHDGFERLVIRHHVPGTIDSFNTYVPCNLPDSLFAGKYIEFKGESQKLVDRFKPVATIAGEEFFTLFLTDTHFRPAN